MGIPSYFSYIIRRYSNIIRKECGRVQLLLMDCNSIIYDSYHKLKEEYKKNAFDLSTIEDRLIQMTIKSICDYIMLISPSKMAYVTFDGVAPMAKMDQQRTRRYKTAFFGSSTEIWNTANITPGTPFMKKLSITVNKYFSLKLAGYSHIDILTSCSDEVGEGEHKLFQYIRDHDCKEDVVAVYGLDADLIMLSLLHEHYTKAIYVFREAPSFKSVISGEFKPGQSLYMDINALSNCIVKEMGHFQSSEKSSIVSSYIMMCVILGNDYMPHMASINVRRDGMEILMETYKREKLIEKGEINWENMKRYISSLGEKEENNLKREMEEREKSEKRERRSRTDEEKEELKSRVGEIYGMDEKYINPKEEGWEKRYYKRIHGITKREEIEKICERYLEGLEWVFKYYTVGCKDWKWKKLEAAPLLKDIQVKKKTLEESPPMTMEEQLEYVMPKEGKKIKLEWAYTKYSWECNVKIED